MKKKIIIVIAFLLMIPVFQAKKVQAYAWFSNNYLYSFDSTRGHRGYARYGTYSRYTPWMCQGTTGSVYFEPTHYDELKSFTYSVCP